MFETCFVFSWIQAVSPSSEIGFDFIQESNDDLKLLIMDHGDWLARMNERMETLQMNTAVFVQVRENYVVKVKV